MTTEQSQMSGNAFIGVSLDSKLFSRAWIHYAINFVLQKHHTLLFLLADDLLRYTRTAKTIDGRTLLNIPETTHLISKRRLEFERFMNTELQHIDDTAKNRVHVRRWNSFTDNTYVQILRNLQIAYTTIVPFQHCVNDVAMGHIKKTFAKLHFPNSLQISAAFLLDEVAMCLRITEMGEFSFEYYPSKQIDILSEIYSDTFKDYGLSVETLTGIDNRMRHFQVLNNDVSN